MLLPVREIVCRVFWKGLNIRVHLLEDGKKMAKSAVSWLMMAAQCFLHTYTLVIWCTAVYGIRFWYVKRWSFLYGSESDGRPCAAEIHFHCSFQESHSLVYNWQFVFVGSWTHKRRFCSFCCVHFSYKCFNRSSSKYFSNIFWTQPLGIYI